MAEAGLTFAFFFILVIISYGFDRLKDYQEKKKLTVTQIEEKNKQDEKNIKKSRLRGFAKKYGDAYVLQIVQGITPGNSLAGNIVHTDVE